MIDTAEAAGLEPARRLFRPGALAVRSLNHLGTPPFRGICGGTAPVCRENVTATYIVALLSALLVKHSRTVTYRPPSAGTRVGCSGISLARSLTGSGLSPYCRSAPRGSASLRRTAHRAGGTIMLAHRLTCRRAVVGSIMRKLPKCQGTLLLPLRVLLLVRRMDLHQRPPWGITALSSLSYGGKGVT